MALLLVTAALAATTVGKASSADPSAELPPYEEASMDSALAGDDECFAGLYGDGCGLSALQRHGESTTRLPSATTPPGAVARPPPTA
eukprot:CAMPEP_0171247526 /NCGR_PEP_ID=MMETSP0790-20130122/48541_1 /TAXON_ID=2925 /ORGANISM="Alexandrium catenella, Strain OF101" /LENGTH=86 /DNA_ID=CAMNT_0011714939 /DNA_START=133 /DNA_END=389 /DNA_ORIENTATION=+